MIAVIDYGAGNIFSVKNALDYLGFDSMLTNKKEDIENELNNAEKLILFTEEKLNKLKAEIDN